MFLEYAKATPDDILIRIEVVNCAAHDATLHVLPTLWFRNSWTWWPGEPRPSLHRERGLGGVGIVAAKHHAIGDRWLYVDGDAPLLFTENETNTERLFGQQNAHPFVKDAFHEYVVHGRTDRVNPGEFGTKAASLHRLVVPAGQTVELRLRLSDRNQQALTAPFENFDQTFADRRAEADDFYAAITPRDAGEEEARVLRQSLAGMLWSPLLPAVTRARSGPPGCRGVTRLEYRDSTRMGAHADRSL